MAKKSVQKYYVVWQGIEPGIYSSWAACQNQIKGYQNALYKSYLTKAEAEKAYEGGWESPQAKHTTRVLSQDWREHVPLDCIAVDAACEGNPGNMEYRGVDLASGQVIFHVGPLAEGTNNIGEFLAIVHALALLSKQNNTKTTIVTDSKTAISWVRRKLANTKLTWNSRNEPIRQLLIRARKWLQENPHYPNPIVKWETEKWGEIPADFGRK